MPCNQYLYVPKGQNDLKISLRLFTNMLNLVLSLFKLSGCFNVKMYISHRVLRMSIYTSTDAQEHDGRRTARV